MENQSYIENYIKQLTSNKRVLASLIMSVLSVICSFLYIVNTNVGAIMLIYSLTTIASAVTIILYHSDVEKKNKYMTEIFIGGVVASILGTVLRVVQLGILYSLRYFIAYFVFCFLLIVMGIKLIKKEKIPTFVFIMFIIAACYEIFEFFYFRFPYSVGFFWKIYHFSTAFLFVAYVLVGNVELEMDGKEYLNQVPSAKICISVFLIISLVTIGIGFLTNLNQNTVTSNKEETVTTNTEKTVTVDNSNSTVVSQNTNNSKTTVSSSTTTESDETKTINIGETVITDMCEFTLNRVELSYDVKPDNPPSYYNHYPASSGQVYIYVNATVKNTGKHNLECDEIYSVDADYNDGYEYSGFNICDDYDGDFTYANINSVEPLQTKGVHCLIDCPEEVETSENSLVLTIKMKDGSKYQYKVR